MFTGLAGMVLAACPSPPNPQPSPTAGIHDLAGAPNLAAAPDGGIPACAASVTETPDGVCNALFTADGHACVACVGGGGCIDRSVEVYCATPSCATDKNCLHVSETVFSGKKRGASK